MMFIKKAANSHGWVNPRDIEEMWKDMFEWLYENEEDFVFPVSTSSVQEWRSDYRVPNERTPMLFPTDYGASRCIRKTTGAGHARTLH